MTGADVVVFGSGVSGPELVRPGGEPFMLVAKRPWSVACDRGGRAFSSRAFSSRAFSSCTDQGGSPC